MKSGSKKSISRVAGRQRGGHCHDALRRGLFFAKDPGILAAALTPARVYANCSTWNKKFRDMTSGPQDRPSRLGFRAFRGFYSLTSIAPVSQASLSAVGWAFMAPFSSMLG